jgi:hypothetical protein
MFSPAKLANLANLANLSWGLQGRASARRADSPRVEPCAGRKRSMGQR